MHRDAPWTVAGAMSDGVYERAAQLVRVRAAAAWTGPAFGHEPIELLAVLGAPDRVRYFSEFALASSSLRRLLRVGAERVQRSATR